MTIIGKRSLLPGMPFDGTHFSRKRPVSVYAFNPQYGHACRMLCLQCDLSDLLEASRPPDPELVDLIEQAFLEGQIDSKTARLTYLWLLGHRNFISESSLDIEIHAGSVIGWRGFLPLESTN